MANLSKTEPIPVVNSDIYIYIWDSPEKLKQINKFKSIVRWRLDQRVKQGQIVFIYEPLTGSYYNWRGSFKYPVFTDNGSFNEFYEGYTITYNKLI